MATQHSQSMYRVFRMGGQPVFAVPTHSKQARLAGINRYQPISKKRTLYRNAMNLAIKTGLDGFLSSTVHNPIVNSPDFDFDAWLSTIRSELNNPDLEAAVFWPPQADRGRVYVHLLDKHHNPIGFAKISFDDHNDDCLINEFKLIEQFSSQGYQRFKVPKVLFYQPKTPTSHAVLMLEALPSDARPLEPSMDAFPKQAATEFAGAYHKLRTDDKTSLSWWQTYLDRRTSPDSAFSRELDAAAIADSDFCRSHGDFGVANLVLDSQGNIWIYDWEESCSDGPVLSDEMCFFLDVNRPNTDAERTSLLRDFRSHFLGTNKPQQRADVMLSLAFRSTVHTSDADLIISQWDKL